MSSPLSLENRLILACARTDPDVQDIQDLVECGPDWHLVLRKVERWRLAPLVHINLRQAARSGQVPNPVAERLRHLYHRDTIHGVGRREVLREALLRFSEARVPVIVLKGAALATLVYPSTALRPMGDIDLLVRSRDLDRVDALLRSMRDAPGSPTVAGAAAGPDADPATRYLTAERFSVLDVRAHIFPPDCSPARLPATACIPIEEFWERARPAQIESVATLVFSHEDFLLHLALHLVYAAGFAGRVRTLCDIRETCKRYEDAIDWRLLVTWAKAYDVGKELYHSLHLSRELVGAGVPSQALTQLRMSFKQLPFEDRFIAAAVRRSILSEDQTAAPVGTVAGVAARLLSTRGVREGATIVFRHLGRSPQVRPEPLVTRNGPLPQSGVTGTPLPAAIVLPIYRPSLEAEPLAAVDRAVTMLRHGDWHLVAPRSLDTSFYEKRYGKPVLRVADAYLGSVQGYSRLLLTDEFYAAFAGYEYMLVIQDDVYVLRDDLPYWLSRRLDYIGAPWPNGHEFVLWMSHQPGIHGQAFRAYVGNGGFSLRRIAACRQLFVEFAQEVAWFREHGWCEDLFFGLFGQFSEQFVLPNLRVAAAFAWEGALPRMHALCQGQLPMAIHAYPKGDSDFFARTILPAAASDH